MLMVSSRSIHVFYAHSVSCSRVLVANHFVQKGHLSLQEDSFPVKRPVLSCEGFESILYMTNSSSCAPSLLGQDKLVPLVMSGSSDFQSSKSDKDKNKSHVTESQEADSGRRDSPDENEQKQDEACDSDDGVEVIASSDSNTADESFDANRSSVDICVDNVDDNECPTRLNSNYPVGMDKKNIKAEGEHITLVISSVPTGFEETLEMYLESSKKGGGKIKLFKYNKRKGTAEVVFEDFRGMLTTTSHSVSLMFSINRLSSELVM